MNKNKITVLKINIVKMNIPKFTTFNNPAKALSLAPSGGISPLGPMQAAYSQCGPEIIPVALGPCSKIIGGPMQRLQNGSCVGALMSNWVDVAQSDAANCLMNENKDVQIFRRYPDPAQGLNYESSNPRVNSQKVTATDCPSGGPCSSCESYGSYNSSENSSLSCNIVGNTPLGTSATPWCISSRQYQSPFIYM